MVLAFVSFTVSSSDIEIQLQHTITLVGVLLYASICFVLHFFLKKKRALILLSLTLFESSLIIINQKDVRVVLVLALLACFIQYKQHFNTDVLFNVFVLSVGAAVAYTFAIQRNLQLVKMFIRSFDKLVEFVMKFNYSELYDELATRNTPDVVQLVENMSSADENW